jgi:peptidoglycan/LPS O-acetylase OafA/YrhL
MDMLRGVAAISVCLFHCCFAGEFLPHESVLSTIAQFGDKGVQIFFILSGYIIPYSLYQSKYTPRNIGNFLLRRILRIHPPYLLALFLTVTSLSLVLKQPLDLSVESVLNNFFYTVPYSSSPWLLNVSWTLGIELQFYFVVGLFFPFFCSKKRVVRWFSILLFLFACFSSSFFSAFANPWYIFPTWTPFFVLGIIIFLYENRLIPKPDFILLSLLTFTVLLFEYTKLLSAVSFLTFFFILLCPRLNEVGMTTYLGKISFSIYLIHLPVILLTAHFMKIKNMISVSSDFAVLTLLTSSVISGVLFFYVCEKPFLILAKSLKLRRER